MEEKELQPFQDAPVDEDDPLPSPIMTDPVEVTMLPAVTVRGAPIVTVVDASNVRGPDAVTVDPSSKVTDEPARATTFEEMAEDTPIVREDADMLTLTTADRPPLLPKFKVLPVIVSAEPDENVHEVLAVQVVLVRLRVFKAATLTPALSARVDEVTEPASILIDVDAPSVATQPEVQITLPATIKADDPVVTVPKPAVEPVPQYQASDT